MELINQHTKFIMEGCKERARAAGLRFESETLEYIVTNRDLLELTPKMMIPTLYDYWVHDVEVLQEKGRYELYPVNPYETVINTRPAISFYNDNNPDWLNVMIFYHVLAHIDFFQNNLFFRHTWDLDFNGQALSDKRLIAALAAEKGRWVDYVIEFSRGIDNLVGFYPELSQIHRVPDDHANVRLDFYFDLFLQSIKRVSIHEYVREIERYNQAIRQYGELGEETFFSDVVYRYPEFDALFRKHEARKREPAVDLMEFLLENSAFLRKEENAWMKSVMQVVRSTSLFFQPQIRTKIMNEGWASYWHEKLFLQDDRIEGHEVEFARVNSGVTTMPRVGLNPYALGMALFRHIEEMADKGRYSYEFKRLADSADREAFDTRTATGHGFIFKIRENLGDFTFINTFVDQDFVNRHRLFVVGKRLNAAKTAWEYYVKSRKVDEYRRMLEGHLYHPPHIVIDHDRCTEGMIYLDHRFEGKPLVKEYIPNTMLGIEYLWGAPVQLETTEAIESTDEQARAGVMSDAFEDAGAARDVQLRRVRYAMKNRQLTRELL